MGAISDDGLQRLANGVDFQELSTTATTEVATEIGYFVVIVNIAFLAEHTNGSGEKTVGTDVLFLIDGNDTVAEVEQTLKLVFIADGQHGVRATEGCQVAGRLA